MQEGLCIVVTPLIALMQDQVDRLRSRSISAVAVHSGLSPRQIDIALDNCVYGDVKFLYLAPERLASEAFRLRLDKMRVSLLAVDEAHCISQWGYDFRPSYLRIAEIRRLIPDTPVLALTASATDLVAKDVMNKLRFGEPNVLRSSFARPNLQYVVRHVEDKNEQILNVIEKVSGSGIIYMRTREGVEKLAAFLTENGISADYYHGGLGHAERSMRQTAWSDDRTRIMVATNAFGMGIDKANVRFVIHYAMSESLEEYYQEAGRAGRDGKRSYAVLLAAPDDAPRVARRFAAEFPPIDEIKHIYERVANYLQVAIGDGAEATFNFNIFEFCQRERLFAGKVESALKLLEMNGYMTLIDEHDNPAKLMFTCSRDSLYKLNVEGNDMDLMLRTLLRMYDGLFSSFRSIDELQIAATSGLSAERVHSLLKTLWQMRVIRYIPSSRSPMIHLTSERLPTNDLYIAPETYHHRYKLMRERFESMIEYVTNQTTCRSVIIEHYFGDEAAKECGVCDLCLARKRAARDSHPTTDTEQRIVELLEAEERSVKELISELEGEPRILVAIVDKLLSEHKISLSEGGKLRINK